MPTRLTNRKASYKALYVDMDDHSRVFNGQMLADKTARDACASTLAALYYYKMVGVRIDAILTDNGSAYRSRRFTGMLRP